MNSQGMGSNSSGSFPFTWRATWSMKIEKQRWRAELSHTLRWIWVYKPPGLMLQTCHGLLPISPSVSFPTISAPAQPSTPGLNSLHCSPIPVISIIFCIQMASIWPAPPGLTKSFLHQEDITDHFSLQRSRPSLSLQSWCANHLADKPMLSYDWDCVLT